VLSLAPIESPKSINALRRDGERERKRKKKRGRRAI